MAGASKEAEVWIDRRKVKRTMESIKPTSGADENSFDAVGILKKKQIKWTNFISTRLEMSTVVMSVIMSSSLQGKWPKLLFIWISMDQTTFCNLKTPILTQPIHVSSSSKVWDYG